MASWRTWPASGSSEPVTYLFTRIEGITEVALFPGPLVMQL